MLIDPRSVVLRPGVPLAHAIEQLELVARKANSIFTGGPQPAQTIGEFVVWAETAEQILGPLFRSDSIRLGLLTDRYWQIRTFTGRSMRPFPAIRAELDAQAERLREVAGLLKTGYGSFPVPDGARAVVVDTNALVHLLPFQQIAWPELVGEASVALVFPLIVIDELDSLSFKSRSVADRAKRVLTDLQNLRAQRLPAEPVAVRRATTVQILLDIPGHVRAPGNDTEILAQVERLEIMVDRPPILVSADMGMRLRATARSIDVRQPPQNLWLKNRPEDDPPLSVSDDPS